VGDTQSYRLDWWHTWAGVHGRAYARRLRTSPPIVIGCDTRAELGREIARAEARIEQYGTNWPGKRVTDLG